MTRIIMVASAALLAALGLGWLFLPQAMAEALGQSGGASQLTQLAAAGPLGLAMLNWLGRGAIYGGIYGKPIVAGNFIHAAVLAGSFVGVQLEGASALGWVLLLASLAYLAAFTRLMFWPPWGVRRGRSESDA